MAALLSLVLIERDLSAQIPVLLESLGYQATGVEAGPLPATGVARIVEEMAMKAKGPREFVRHAYDQGWTVIGDESGRCIECGPLWQNVATEQGCRVLTLYCEQTTSAFAVYDADGLRRAVLYEDGALSAERGPKLPIEMVFRGPGLTVNDLLMLSASMGIDFAHLNARSSYTVVEVEEERGSWDEILASG